MEYDEDEHQNKTESTERCHRNEENSRPVLLSSVKQKSKKCYPKKAKIPKPCVVCGDIARVRNFGAVTCDSCKTFFRRHAKRQEDLVCPFINKCEVNIRSRRKCPKCRMIKCLLMGMKVELVNIKFKIKANKNKNYVAAYETGIIEGLNYSVIRHTINTSSTGPINQPSESSTDDTGPNDNQIHIQISLPTSKFLVNLSSTDLLDKASPREPVSVNVNQTGPVTQNDCAEMVHDVQQEVTSDCQRNITSTGQ